MKLKMPIALAIATAIYLTVTYAAFAAEQDVAGIKKQVMAAYIFDLIENNASLQAERILLVKKNQELQGQIDAQKKPAAEDKP